MILLALTAAPPGATFAEGDAATHGGDGYTVRYDGDWIIYDRGPTAKAKSTSTVEIVDGTRSEDGVCDIEFSASAGPDEQGTWLGQEIAYNPTTCQSKVRTTRLTAAEARAIAGQHDGKRAQQGLAPLGEVSAPAVEVDDADEDSSPTDSSIGTRAIKSRTGWTQ